MKKIWGSFLYGLSKVLDWIMQALIAVLSVLVNIVEKLRESLQPLLLLLLSLVFFLPIVIIPLVIRPYGFSSGLWIFILVLLLFPLLGKKLISFLEYGRYVLTEFLYDRADYYRLKKNTKRPFSSYSTSYRRKKMREEEEARQRARREQEAYWENLFKQFFQNYGYSSWEDYASRGGFNQGGYEGYQQQQQQYNPFSDFSRQYEASCDTLGVPYDTDEYEVKLAFRKLAKKYHPDVSDDPNAKEKFQKVNDAYAFLSRENIERYKKMH